MAATGTLYLVPGPLDFGCDVQAPLTNVLPDGTLRVAARLEHWIAENAKTTRAFLKRVNEVHALAHPLQALAITELPRDVHKHGDHAGGFDARPLLAAALDGHDVGLASEAGMPAIADPGSSVVRAAHALHVPVVPLVGPVVAAARDWQPAASTASRSPSSATCRSSRRRAWHVSGNWRRWRDAAARASCSSRRRTGMWRSGKHWSRPCGPTRGCWWPAR